MSSTEPTIEYERNGDWIEELTKTPTELNDPARVHKWKAYRWLSVSLSDGQVATGGTDTETVTVSAVNGLKVVRGTDPTDATVLSHDGDVTVIIDGTETTKTLSDGSVSFDLMTTKSAGSEIEIVAKSLLDHPADPDRAIIEVV